MYYSMQCRAKTIYHIHNNKYGLLCTILSRINDRPTELIAIARQDKEGHLHY